jgi:GTPase Era involved in 16S rRNA processing
MAIDYAEGINVNLMQGRAAFAVVGHPNKGKSSIVSTLARDDSVLVSQRSGTTTHSDSYKIDTGKAGYELIDTPGFQRPKKVLHWLNQNATSADQRATAVQKFIHDIDCQNNFPDEVRLLTPLMNGAAILYVVDGSRPYGIEYEAEMEILRWTGRPSMALINPIENESHVESWKSALQQYFKIVTVFNPMQADFNKQIALLNAFSHLEPSWQSTLTQVVTDLNQQQELIEQQAILILSELLVDLCNYQNQQKVLTEKQAQSLKTLLNQQYNQWMTSREQQAFETLCDLFAHGNCNLNTQAIDYPPELFDSDQWYMWGLNKKQLAAVSAMTGALAGAAVDVAVAGHSFMLGAIGGGLLGLSSALLGADKLASSKIKGLPLGGYLASQGPINNPNFPYVVIGRFLFLYQQLKTKNHADRSAIELKNNLLQERIESMQKSESKRLHICCKRLASQKAAAELIEVLSPLFR